MSIQLSIRSVDYGPLRVFNLKGYLAQLEIYRFKRAVEQALFDGKRIIIANLKDLEFMDSSGIASLIYLTKQATKFDSQSLVVSPPKSGVSRVLEAASLGQFIQIYPSLEEALESRGIARTQEPDQPADLVTQADLDKTGDLRRIQ
ncbi:STAS domain-containing protein [bacterium]|nr:STAS domain-containing protein [bacterium]